MESQPRDLPVEILCQILCLSSPLDVVRLRVLSKRFRDITHDPWIWRTLYANAKLPRPPGPFPFHSIRFLETTLTRSARLARTWTTRQIRAIRSEDLDVGSLPTSGVPALVGGRWLIGCDSYKRIVLYDMDPDWETYRALDLVLILWEDEQENLKLWDACSIMRSKELLLYVIFRHSPSPGVPWKMMEFRLNRDTGHMTGYTSLQVPVVRTSIHFAFVHLVCNQRSWLYLRGLHLILDIETRIFYHFPEVDIGLPPGMQSMGPHLVLLTNTHVVALYSRHGDGATLVKVSIVPTDPQPTEQGSYFLQLTHEGETYDKFPTLLVIKQPSISPITGSTTLRFLQLREDETSTHSTLQFRCVDITLHEIHANVALPLPISIHSHDLFSIADASCHPLAHKSATHIEHSPDGHVRGIYMRYPAPRSITPGSPGFFITKFTIDASPDECTAVHGSFSPPIVHMDDILFRAPPAILFDGIGGRLYYGVPGEGRRSRPHASVAIVDVE